MKRPSPPPQHAWSQAKDGNIHPLGSRTEITQNDDGKYKNSSSSFLSPGFTTIVSVEEVERIVESLVPFTVESVGTSTFLEMYGFQVERLSLQAHASARQGDGTGGDEFVVESILTFGKLPVLVRTLLAVEAWRTHVLLPQLASMAGENGNALRCAFIMHVETSLVGLINLVLYRREGCEQMDGETVIALVDYCARCLARLAIPLPQNEMVHRQKNPISVSDIKNYMTSRSPVEEIRETCLDTEYKTCVAATSTARYLCEHINVLSLGAQTRILDTHDFLVMMVPLVDEPPWTRTHSERANGERVWEKLIDNQWERIPPGDLLQVTKCEAQCWLTIYHLTCTNNICREQYGLNTFRKEQLLRLRKFLNDVILDQLPVLADVMRYMDELTLINVPETSTWKGSSLLMQQVCLVRDSIVKGRDWKEVANTQYVEIFSKVTDATDKDLRRISDVYNLNGFEDIVGERSKPFEPAFLKIETVFLRIMKNGSYEEVCLIPVGTGTPFQNKEGSFRRFKMSIGQVEGSSGKLLVYHDAKAVANVSFDSLSAFKKTLACDNLNLPLSSSKKEWRQLGSLNEKLILQLGFVRLESNDVCEGEQHSSCYTLCQAFLSQPFVEDEK